MAPTTAKFNSLVRSYKMQLEAGQEIPVTNKADYSEKDFAGYLIAFGAREVAYREFSLGISSSIKGGEL